MTFSTRKTEIENLVMLVIFHFGFRFLLLLDILLELKDQGGTVVEGVGQGYCDIMEWNC